MLSESTARTMQSPLFTNAPGIHPMLHGFLEGKLNGERTIWHNGGIVAFCSLLCLIPEHNAGFLIAYNGDAGAGADDAFE